MAFCSPATAWKFHLKNSRPPAFQPNSQLSCKPPAKLSALLQTSSQTLSSPGLLENLQLKNYPNLQLQQIQEDVILFSSYRLETSAEKIPAPNLQPNSQLPRAPGKPPAEKLSKPPAPANPRGCHSVLQLPPGNFS
jgi:hypothetical protein